jgi:hypothetical protein
VQGESEEEEDGDDGEKQDHWTHRKILLVMRVVMRVGVTFMV